MLSQKKGKSTLYYSTVLWLVICGSLFVFSQFEPFENEASSGFRGFFPFISFAIMTIFTFIYVIILLVYLFKFTFSMQNKS